jgi:hypothetical protein
MGAIVVECLLVGDGTGQRNQGTGPSVQQRSALHILTALHGTALISHTNGAFSSYEARDAFITRCSNSHRYCEVKTSVETSVERCVEESKAHLNTRLATSFHCPVRERSWRNTEYVVVKVVQKLEPSCSAQRPLLVFPF